MLLIFILASIYISPPFFMEVIWDVAQFIYDKDKFPMLVMGDFNYIMNDVLDRMGGSNV